MFHSQRDAHMHIRRQPRRRRSTSDEPSPSSSASSPDASTSSVGVDGATDAPDSSSYRLRHSVDGPDAVKKIVLQRRSGSNSSEHSPAPRSLAEKIARSEVDCINGFWSKRLAAPKRNVAQPRTPSPEMLTPEPKLQSQPQPQLAVHIMETSSTKAPEAVMVSADAIPTTTGKSPSPSPPLNAVPSSSSVSLEKGKEVASGERGKRRQSRPLPVPPCLPGQSKPLSGRPLPTPMVVAACPKPPTEALSQAVPKPPVIPTPPIKYAPVSAKAPIRPTPNGARELPSLPPMDPLEPLDLPPSFDATSTPPPPLPPSFLSPPPAFLLQPPPSKTMRHRSQSKKRRSKRYSRAVTPSRDSGRGRPSSGYGHAGNAKRTSRASSRASTRSRHSRGTDRERDRSDKENILYADAEMRWVISSADGALVPRIFHARAQQKNLVKQLSERRRKRRTGLAQIVVELAAGRGRKKIDPERLQPADLPDVVAQLRRLKAG